MNRIGYRFGYEASEVAVIEPAQREVEEHVIDFDAEQAIREKGLAQAIKALREYFNNELCLLSEAKREEVLSNKMARIKDRYFSRI